MLTALLVLGSVSLIAAIAAVVWFHRLIGDVASTYEESEDC